MAKRDHPHTITRWTTTSNGTGGYNYGTPSTLNGRWEDIQELTRNAQGDEILSKAEVYVESDVAIGDYLALGDQTATADPTTLDNAHEVKQFNKIPDLRGNTYERKAIL